ncbi:YihY/virulence factor BrkB family protein [Roseibium algae]|uniref:YihY/virulence factor BrkB family protein n=1 Tax=Roseibium algae TaxID=3123038 RepID=A0ABU8TNK7_9HYPH
MEIKLIIRSFYQVLRDALGHLNRDDGFAMASHVALSGLLAIFPLLIFIAALAGFLGLEGAADQVSDLVFASWPDQVAAPVVREVHQILTVPRGDVLTFGVVAALWFASSGIEAMRTALNRAYRQRETRSFILLRLQSLGLVILGAAILISYTFLVVLAPLVIAAVIRWVPAAEEVLVSLDIARYAVAGSLLVVGLMMVHWLLPAGRRNFFAMLPGVLATLVLWMIAGVSFGKYLASFANYVSTYGGLAGIMTALVFLYICSLVFIFGGELNASLIRQRNLTHRDR